jgi:hypothetical protein
MQKRIVNGVLITREAGRVDWSATTVSGLPVTFRPRMSGGWTAYINEDQPDEQMSEVYQRIEDAVQWVRSKGRRFPPVVPNAQARKRGDVTQPGWTIYPDDTTIPSRSIMARGRHATLSDLYRRDFLYVTGDPSPSLNVVPVYYLAG